MNEPLIWKDRPDGTQYDAYYYVIFEDTDGVEHEMIVGVDSKPPYYISSARACEVVMENAASAYSTVGIKRIVYVD